MEPSTISLYDLAQPQCWAKISLMGHRVEWGTVQLVNIGSVLVPVPMLLVEIPAIDPAPSLLRRNEMPRSDGSHYWWVSKPFAGQKAEEYLFSPQAVFSIEPTTKAEVIEHHLMQAGGMDIGAWGQASLCRAYQIALANADLLNPGPWTEAHEAVIQLVDAEKEAEIEALSSDPFSEDDEK